MQMRQGIGLMLLLGQLGCADMDQSLRELKQNTVRIGGLLTLTGALGKEGRGILYGAKIAAEEINGLGGINGQELEIIVEDDQINPEAALAAAAELKGLEVKGIIGALASSMTILTAESVFIPAGIPVVSAASTSPKITSLVDNNLVWRTVPSDAYQGEFLATKMKQAGISNASVIHIDNAYGAGLAARYKEVFLSLGGRVASTIAYPENKQKDFAAEVAQALQSLVDGDALVILGYATDSAAIGIALEAANPPRLSYWGCDGNAGSAFLANSPVSILRSIKGSSFRNTSGPIYEQFVENYSAATGGSVATYSANGYDAMYAIALAMARAGENSSSGLAANLAQISSGTGTKIFPGEFGKAVDLLKQGTEIDYSGVSGEVDFDNKGDIKINSNDLEKFYYIWRVKEDLSDFEEDL